MVQDYWLTEGTGVNLLKMIEQWDGSHEGDDYAGFAELFSEETITPAEARIKKLVMTGR